MSVPMMDIILGSITNNNNINICETRTSLSSVKSAIGATCVFPNDACLLLDVSYSIQKPVIIS